MLSETTHLLVSQALVRIADSAPFSGDQNDQDQSLHAARNISQISSYREIDLPTWCHSVVFRSLGSVTLSFGASASRT